MSTTESLPIDVLLVEDNAAMAEMMLTCLAHLKLKTQHKSTGEEAWELLENYKPDLILLDLSLPKMSGWELLEKVKAKYGDHDIPVIVVTALTDKPNRIIGRLQYVSRYLTKPFTIQELSTAINDVLELYKVHA
jgi:DNA-binding response OmpR family regulator